MKDSGMDNFKYKISKWVPFQDPDVCKKIRSIKQEDLCSHPNRNLKIEIVKDDEFAFRRVYDIFFRIKQAADEDKKLVLILPQPHPQYIKVAYLVNKFRVNCSRLYTFNMDEWADEDGNIAPETWPNGFMYAMKNNFYNRLDKDLRPPEDNIQGPTNKNLKDYGKMIENLGGADVCYGGIGWSGHVAFIEPGAPEFDGSFEDWKEMGTRIVTLSPFTIAQSCLDADFGMSGDWSWIPPKAATIGPAQIIGARLRSSWNSFTISSTDVSWQRFTIRLAIHGPVTNKVPASILQIGPTEMHISESVSKNIEIHRELSWYS
jgi:6-phosphogluconolactonase/glucosamine-6-phosphate isomerase/deaminase